MGGEYAFRLGGEKHVWDPDTISDLQYSVRSGDKKNMIIMLKKLMVPSNGNLNPRSLFKIKYLKILLI